MNKYLIEIDENELSLLKAAMKTMKPIIQAPATQKALRNLYKQINKKLANPEKQRIVTLQ